MMFGGPGMMRGMETLGERPAGIPAELFEAAQRLTAEEPTHERQPVAFDPAHSPWKGKFSFPALFAIRGKAVLTVVCMIAVEAFLAQIGPHLIAYGINDGMAPDKLDYGVVELAAMVFLGAVALTLVIGNFRIRIAGRAGEEILYRLRVSIFTQIQRLSMDYFGREKAGVIMTRMTSDVEVLQVLFQEGFPQMMMQAMTLVVVTVILFLTEARLAAVVVFGIVPVMLLLTLWYRAASDKGFLAARERVGDVLSDLQENLSGSRVVTAYNRQKHNAVRHRNIAGRYLDANVYTARISAMYIPSTQAITYVAQAVIVLIGGGMVRRGEMQIGTLVEFIIYLNAFVVPIQGLVQMYTQYQQSRAAMTKLRELFTLEPTVLEKPNAVDLPQVRGGIELEDVSFGYLPGRPVLHGVSMTIEPGETIAFVGPTGAGKSTVAKLLARFYDPFDGVVRIDGHDLRDVTIGSLRSQLGIVPQLGFLFGGTIRDNIAFGQPGVTDDEIFEACDRVGVREIVEGLPQGLDTVCHERGITLSSGERQLIALARALVANPRILVLDEATSNLDLATEAKIEQALDVLLDGRTAILIAHRLNTARRADRIAVIDHGNLVELGTHDELVGLGGVYTSLNEAWTRRAEHDTA